MSFRYALFALIASIGGGLAVAATPAPPARDLDGVARAYVDVGLSLVRHDRNPIAFFGPVAWQVAGRQDQRSLPDLERTLESLLADLAALAEMPQDSATNLRTIGLQSRVVAMRTRIRILQGNMPASFDEETRLMFGVVVPRKSEEHFRKLIAELDQLLPGSGPLQDRLEAFREQFVIPPSKLERIMSFTLEQCRQRTRRHLALPAQEKVSLRIVRNQPWVGFTQYLGNGRSVIFINQDVPVHIERAIELGCHEGYPGHHVNATLVEAEMARRRGWAEYMFFPLYGPTSVVAEGIANYGVELAYDKQERLAFEKTRLLRMAGMKARDFDLYTRYLSLQQELNYARNEVARLYLYEGMPRERAIEWLRQYGLETQATAKQRLDFIDAYRTYVVCYNYGLDVVKGYVAGNRGSTEGSDWPVFARILSGAITPDEILRAQAP